MGSIDVDNISNTGYHMVMGNGTNLPSSAGQYGLLYTKINSVTMKVQYYYDTQQHTYYRHFSESQWYAWKRVYDESILTDSTILSPLAAALGGIIYRGSLEGDVDFSASTFFQSGFWTLDGITGTALSEISGVDFGILAYIGKATAGVQIIFSLAWQQSGTSIVLYRLNWSNSQSPWRKAAFTMQ